MNETVRLTYSELAQARGITLPAARRLALRRKWRKQVGNDGLTHVWVPVEAIPSDGGSGGTDDAAAEPVLDEATIALLAKATADAVSGVVSDLRSDFKSVVPTLQDAIISLRVELFAERERADRAEKRVRELEARRWWRWRGTG